MPLEGVGAPDVPDHGPRIPVTRLVHDPREIRPALGRRGDIACSQGVRSERRGVETGGHAIALDDVGDRLCGQPRHLAGRRIRGAHVPRPRHRPEHRARGDLGCVEPFAHQGDRADEPAVRDGFLESPPGRLSTGGPSRAGPRDPRAGPRHQERRARSAGTRQQTPAQVAPDRACRSVYRACASSARTARRPSRRPSVSGRRPPCAERHGSRRARLRLPWGQEGLPACGRAGLPPCGDPASRQPGPTPLPRR